MCLYKLGDCEFGDWKVNRFLALMQLCCASDEDLSKINKSLFVFLYDNLGQQQNPQSSQETCSGFVMKLTEAFVGAAHVGGVVL